MKIIKKIILILTITTICILNFSTVQAANKRLSTPKDIKTSISGTSNVKIKWTKVKKAFKYTIYRATTKSGKYTKIVKTKSTSYVDTKTQRGKTYYYKVVANETKNNSASKKSAVAKVTVPSKSKALKEIRKALKNKQWVNKNLKMKKNCFSDKISSKSKQILTFEKFKNRELVLVQNYCEDELSVQHFLVGYYNGKVVVKKLSEYPMHDGHYGISVDTKNSIVNVYYMHMGYEGLTYYKVSNVKFTQKSNFYNNENTGDETVIYKFNDKNVSKTKYKNELNKYKKYKFNLTSKRLTTKNIDKYIK